MSKEIKEWKENGKHLPKILRDFHDQKDIFSLLEEKLNIEEHEVIKNISKIEGHCYVFDAFLWLMANYGYTLQKNKTKLNFHDLEKDINEMKNKKREMFASIINKNNK